MPCRIRASSRSDGGEEETTDDRHGDGSAEPHLIKGSRSSKDEGQEEEQRPSGILRAPSQKAQLQEIYQEIEDWIEGVAEG